MNTIPLLTEQQIGNCQEANSQLAYYNDLIAYALKHVKKENNLDLKNDPLALQRLKEAAEKAKIELSSAQQT